MSDTNKNTEVVQFEINADDTAIDTTTGLIWTRDNVGGGRLDFDAASKACNELELDGHSDWRMPTIRELLTLVDYEKFKPCIDTNVFNCELSWYLTSTPYAPSPGDCAWYVYFNGGYASWGSRDGSGFVRAVRGGQ